MNDVSSLEACQTFAFSPHILLSTDTEIVVAHKKLRKLRRSFLLKQIVGKHYIHLFIESLLESQ